MAFAFQDRECLYLVMDYLDGGDLRYHLGNRQFFNEK
jgi:serine/threonine protein kinase